MSARRAGELAIVLHTHMPYVEGFGTWPFGEEMLWEAIATSYLPLLEVLERGAPLTLSLTPVLADQLEAPDISERFADFITGVRRTTHGLDIEALRARGEHDAARELERSGGDYELALERMHALGGDLLGALRPHIAWTSSATHAVLPLLATDAGIRLQLGGGIDAHRARFGSWDGGFWLPECAHAPWLDTLLSDAGVHATCVDLSGVYGAAAPGCLRPLQSEVGPLLAPLDRSTIELVWSDGGFPAHPVYRDYHRLSPHHHRPWANDGAPYERKRALAQVREHARDFVARVLERLERDGATHPGGGLVVCALDTELLGHWWYEGVDWLAAVLEEAAAQGLALARLDDALARHEPLPLAAGSLPVTSWGAGRDLATWEGPRVAELAFAARAAELELVAAGAAAGEALVRELLALQSSDWAFLVSTELAAPYGRERAGEHLRALRTGLAGEVADAAHLRNLAVHARATGLLEP